MDGEAIISITFQSSKRDRNCSVGVGNTGYKTSRDLTRGGGAFAREQFWREAMRGNWPAKRSTMNISLSLYHSNSLDIRVFI